MKHYLIATIILATFPLQRATACVPATPQESTPPPSRVLIEHDTALANFAVNEKGTRLIYADYAGLLTARDLKKDEQLCARCRDVAVPGHAGLHQP
jgi:hypothetical protein